MNIKYTDEMLSDAVSKSKSWAEVERFLSKNKKSGSRQIYFKKRAINLGLDFSHFTGAAWRRGKNFTNSNIKLKYTDEQMFCNPSYVSRQGVRRRLMGSQDFVHECEICKNNTWMNKPISLILDHIDGNKLNQTRENLRFICPNCDAQTDTYKGKNIKKQKETVSEEDIKQSILNSYTYSEVCRKLGLPNHGNTTKKIKRIMVQNEIEFKSHKPKEVKKIRKSVTEWNQNFCADCERKIDPKATRCRSCAGKIKGAERSKIIPKEKLENLIWQKPSIQIAKDVGVSDKAVEKWCKKYGISKPPRGYWNRRQAGMSHEDALNPPEKIVDPKFKKPPLEEDEVKKVHKLLEENNLTLRQIGEMVDRSHFTIIKIRDGKGVYAEYLK